MDTYLTSAPCFSSVDADSAGSGIESGSRISRPPVRPAIRCSLQSRTASPRGFPFDTQEGSILQLAIGVA